MRVVGYNKILVTHDGSRLAQKAIPHAISIAKTYNAELVVLQVVDSFIRLIRAVTMTPATIGTEGKT